MATEKTIVLVVVACGFENENKLCRVAISRLWRAFDRYQRLCGVGVNTVMVVTGNVPHHPGGATLAWLMRNWLLNRGVPEHKIYPVRDLTKAIAAGPYPGEGVGTCSEADNTTEFFGRDMVSALSKNTQPFELEVFASSWYFKSGRTIWNYYAKKRVPVRLMPEGDSLDEQCGLKTSVIYGCYGLIAWLAARLGLMPAFAKLMKEGQGGRLIKGYPKSGCD